ncbi:MAG TPA: hypothetical protein VJ123_09970 [Anaerolineales bacterium]|nr:hypothetical protein [Anaerolineales bacterium]
MTESLVLTLLALYGDHHTTEVRRILSEIAGVTQVYASSAFRQVVIHFDPKKVKPQALEKALADRGYRSDAAETAYATPTAERATRHTAAYPGVGSTISFAQKALSWEGRPLWPCPGLDYQVEEEPN